MLHVSDSPLFLLLDLVVCFAAQEQDGDKHFLSLKDDVSSSTNTSLCPASKSDTAAQQLVTVNKPTSCLTNSEQLPSYTRVSYTVYSVAFLRAGHALKGS